MKMEPIVSSETSAIRTQTPGNYPKRNKLHLEHGESLKTRLLRKIIGLYTIWLVSSAIKQLQNKYKHLLSVSMDMCRPKVRPFVRAFNTKAESVTRGRMSRPIRIITRRTLPSTWVSDGRNSHSYLRRLQP